MPPPMLLPEGCFDPAPIPDGFEMFEATSPPFEFDLGPLLLFPQPPLFLSSGLAAPPPAPAPPAFPLGLIGLDGAY